MIPSRLVLGGGSDIVLEGTTGDIQLDGGKFYPDKDDTDSYIYQAAADQIQFVAGNATILACKEAATDSAELGSAVILQWASRSIIKSSADGKIEMTNAAGQGIQLDMTTNSALTLTDEAAGALSLIVDKITADLAEGIVFENGLVPSASSKYCHVFEDFLGSFAALDNATRATDGSEPSGPWVISQTETTANAVIHALVADADDGQFKLGFSADNEEQAAVLYWGDEACIPGDKNPIFTCRLKVDAQAATLDSTTELAFGLCDAQNNDINAATHQASFSMDGANLDLLTNSDDNSTPVADDDTDVNLTDNTFYEFKIDCSDPADVLFFYRSTLGGAWTAVNTGATFAISGAANFQPFFQIHKAADTNTDAIIIDYVSVQWDRG